MGCWMLGVGCWGGLGTRNSALETSAAPHLPQKAKPAGFSNPHCGQRGVRGFPHLPQKFMPSGLSKPQPRQRIGFLVSRIVSFLLYKIYDFIQESLYRRGRAGNDCFSFRSHPHMLMVRERADLMVGALSYRNRSFPLASWQ